MDGVTLTTMHAAKGLEWDAVFIVGCSEGLLPISLADSADAVEEEKRLLYVAITRAREHLALSYARARREGGKATRKRTRFLESQWPDARPTTVKRQPVSAALGELDAGQVRLFEELKDWRLGIAKSTSKPAFTVLVDVSLVQIARDRPRTLGDLARVNGIGASKLESYGADILEIVGRH
ncbi:MAG: HRDC domain-containing protein [Demequina sp.]|nr:HRDC domain-containing protein [Demequina sp.]